jgi:hypothetical protein
MVQRAKGMGAKGLVHRAERMVQRVSVFPLAVQTVGAGIFSRMILSSAILLGFADSTKMAGK